MRKSILTILLLSLAFCLPAQGIIGSFRKSQPSKVSPTQSSTKSNLDTLETAVLEELGLSDDSSTSLLPKQPQFQVPDTTMPLGWIPDKTSRLINDYTGILTKQQELQLEQTVLKCYDSSRVEIAILIVPDLGGDAIESFCQNVWSKWHIGNKEKNNGVLIVIKPKNSTDGQVRIQTGYGMEGPLPDAFCRRIIDDKMIPQFRQNDYFQGIVDALDVIIPVAEGEYSLEQYEKDNRTSFSDCIFIILFIGIALFIFIRLARHIGNSGGGFIGGGPSIGGFGGGNFSGGFGGFGGGFGGFGGGSSGGGGASGRW